MAHLPRSEKRVLLLCALFLTVTAILSYLFLYEDKEKTSSPFSEADLKQAKYLQDEISKANNKAIKYDTVCHISKKLFPFDPNHDDSLTLSRIGLSPWQIHNMMRYREAGGIWRSVDDFRRLYGLSEKDFQKLRPYIRIAAADRKKKYIPYQDYSYSVPQGEIPNYEHIDKMEEGQRIDANTSDTTEIKRIPGIGSYYARKIVTYRDRLGGFVNTNQIEEIEGLPAGTSRWFTIEKQPTIKKIRINHASFKEIVRHPYISYEQTKVIVNHIRHYGPLQGWNELRLYKEFQEKDFILLEPYFSFQ